MVREGGARERACGVYIHYCSTKRIGNRRFNRPKQVASGILSSMLHFGYWRAWAFLQQVPNIWQTRRMRMLFTSLSVCMLVIQVLNGVQALVDQRHAMIPEYLAVALFLLLIVGSQWVFQERPRLVNVLSRIYSALLPVIFLAARLPFSLCLDESQEEMLHRDCLAPYYLYR
jgi:hypothetical protein